MRANLTVRNRFRVIERRRRMPDFQHAGNGTGRRAGLQLRIGGIDRPDAVDCEVVVIHLGCNRTHRQAPHAVGAFREGPGTVKKLAGQLHLVALSARSGGMSHDRPAALRERRRAAAAARAHGQSSVRQQRRTVSPTFFMAVDIIISPPRDRRRCAATSPD